MKYFSWSAEKNERLQAERGISFERVILSIAEGGLLDILEHPNKEKYSNQQLMVVRVGDYAHLVPFVETETEFFLKTIIPSRKATRKYIHEEENDA